jgi:hypothetical protein
MNRITEKDLQATVDQINHVTHSPAAPWVHEAGRSVANIGNYHLDGAYGGVSLHRMENEHGGVSDVFRCGHISKRDLYERMHAFLAGLATEVAA